jgi:oligopeptide transport system substrate-binding protein
MRYKNSFSLFFNFYDKEDIMLRFFYGFVLFLFSAGVTAQTELNQIRFPLISPLTTLNPSQAQNGSDLQLTAYLFSALTQLNPQTYQVEPALAQRWSISNNGLHYIFHLRPQLRWNNGEPITAQDMVDTLHFHLKPENKMPFVRWLYPLKNAQAIHQGQLEDVTQLGVRALDKETLIFTLMQPTPYFLTLTSLMPYVPLPAVLLNTEMVNLTDIKQLPSSGAYQLQDITEGLITLIPNANYFNPNQQQVPLLKLQWMNPEMDLMILAKAESNENKIISSLKQHQLPQFCTLSYIFNVQKFPVDQTLIRKAISASIDRQLLLDLLHKTHSPAFHFTPPLLLGVKEEEMPELFGISFDPEAAQLWLNQVHADLNIESEWPPTLTLILPDEPESIKTAETIAHSLKYHLNLTLELKPYPTADYLQQIAQGNWNSDLLQLTWCGDYPDAHSWLYEMLNTALLSPLIAAKYVNVVALMQRSLNLPVPEQRHELYQYMEHLLIEQDAVILPLYFLNSRYYMDSVLKMAYLNPFNGAWWVQ